jgi:MoxR-like ATPase
MQESQEKIQELLDEVGKVIVGQENLKRDIVIALLSGGHILLEGAPGLAKTRTISTFSEALRLDFQRIQFTPDLLPSDLIGAKIYDPDAKIFEVKKGPIFANFVLADEINRAPSKVQSALLESMEERQVTIWEETFILDEPFMVLATQNPLEQEGTFHLPEAQLDRFLLKSLVGYPTALEEKEILTKSIEREQQKISKVFGKKDITSIKKQLEKIEVSQSIYEYICRVVFASRNREKYPEISYGWSPRASLALLKTSKVLAGISGRDFVLPEDVKEMAYWVLRHRIILSYEAMAEDISTDDMIERILADVKIG